MQEPPSQKIFTQHGVLSWDLNFKKRQERTIKRNLMKIFRKYQDRKE